MTSPCIGFSWAVSGMMMPPVVFSSAFEPTDHDTVMQGTEIH